MNSVHFRPLVPGPPPRTSLDSKPLRKKQRVSVACNECRAKKTAVSPPAPPGGPPTLTYVCRQCDGRKPVCAACQARPSECTYRNTEEHETPTMALKRENDTLRENVTTLEVFIKQLRSAPDDIARDILQKLRSAPDLFAVVRAATGEVINGQPSEKTTALGILPQIHSDAEFELMVRHPNAYPTVDLSKDRLLSSEAPLGAPAPDGDLAPPTARASVPTVSVYEIADADTAGRERQRTAPPLSTASSSDGETVPRYFDSRLARLKIAFWTSVGATDEYAARAISLYLQTDYPVFGLFDADLFIRDLVEFNFDYCSAFMVSSLLAFASVSSTTSDISVQNS